MTGDRERRLALNETFARRFNEMVEYERTHDMGSDNFVCECSRHDCPYPIDIDVAEYARVRSNPRRFIVKEGHENREIESVVEKHTAYVVVQKHGEAGRAVETDA